MAPTGQCGGGAFGGFGADVDESERRAACAASPANARAMPPAPPVTTMTLSR
jgi:hypothetical protein